MDIEGFFNSNYDQVERYWWSTADHRYSARMEDHPRSLITQQMLRVLRGATPGKALDVGCGEGADAIRLALMGWSVDACDLSEVGVEKARGFAAEEGVSVNFFKSRVEDVPLVNQYDLVISNGVLHYVEDKDPAIQRLQDATIPGGVHVVSLWSDYTPVPQVHRIVPTFPDGEDGVVVNAYRDWPLELLYFEREKAESSHSDLGGHVHSYIKLIARKPS